MTALTRLRDVAAVWHWPQHLADWADRIVDRLVERTEALMGETDQDEERAA